MQDGSTKFRRYAEECLRLAEQVQSLDDKAALLTMAGVWVRLADQGYRVNHLSGENGPRDRRETG
jgi:hypothetical protein